MKCSDTSYKKGIDFKHKLQHGRLRNNAIEISVFDSTICKQMNFLKNESQNNFKI